MPTSAENGRIAGRDFVLLRLGAARKAANDPAKRALLDKKEELERKIDLLKYQKARHVRDKITRANSPPRCWKLARVQEDLDK